MPNWSSRQVTTNTMVTGVIGPALLANVLTASTGRYGLQEFVFLPTQDLTTIMASYSLDTQVVQARNFAGGAGGSSGSNDMSRYIIKTHCHSRLANTTGTTIIVDFLCFATRVDLAQASAWPTSFTGDYCGSPLTVAQQCFWNTVDQGSDPQFSVEQLDIKFWYAPQFRRFYRLVRHHTFTLEHGQNTEFIWKLPTVTISPFELKMRTAVNDVAGVPTYQPKYLKGKTFFTCWRIRGALGSVSHPLVAGNTASTAISSAVLSTTRQYHVKAFPSINPVTKLNEIGGGYPASGTQVWVNNEYGTGSILQPASTT